MPFVNFSCASRTQPVNIPGRNDDHLQVAELRNPDGFTIGQNANLETGDIAMAMHIDTMIDTAYDNVFKQSALE